MGIAELIIMAMEKEGLPHEQCIKKIWMVDSKGLIVKVRSSSMTSYIYISVDIQTHHVVCIGIYTLLIQSCLLIVSEHYGRSSLEFVLKLVRIQKMFLLFYA